MSEISDTDLMVSPRPRLEKINAALASLRDEVDAALKKCNEMDFYVTQHNGTAEFAQTRVLEIRDPKLSEYSSEGRQGKRPVKMTVEEHRAIFTRLLRTTIEDLQCSMEIIDEELKSLSDL